MFNANAAFVPKRLIEGFHLPYVSNWETTYKMLPVRSIEDRRFISGYVKMRKFDGRRQYRQMTDQEYQDFAAGFDK